MGENSTCIVFKAFWVKMYTAYQHLLSELYAINLFRPILDLFSQAWIRAASEPENAPRFLVLEESIRTRLIA